MADTDPHTGGRALSIRFRLPLITGSLLVLVAAALSWVAYLQVVASAKDSAEARLHGVATQIAESLTQGARALVVWADSVAVRPAIRAYLRAPTEPLRTTLESAMRGATADLVTTELWDRSFRRVLAGGPGTVDTTVTRPLLDSIVARASTRIGEVVLYRDTILYPIIVPIREDEALLGALVQWRKIRATQEGLARFERTIGSGATLLLGNERQNLWTDLAGAARLPPFGREAMQSLLDYDREGMGRRFGAVAPAGGTPWLVLVEFPAAEVLGGAQTFLRRLLAMGILFVVAGLVATWLAMRTITRPVEELAAAATAIAAGDFAQRVPVWRRDELGQTAAIFNTMAARLGEGNALLERKVEERTARLRASEAQFQTLVDSAPDAIVTADEHWNITYFNPSAERIFGLAADAVRGKPLSLLLPAWDADAAGRVPEATPVVPRRADELMGRRADGTPFPVELAVTSWERDGRLVHCAILRDVTTRMQLSESLRRYASELRDALQRVGESESQLTQILDAVPVGVFVTDAEGRPHLVNRRAHELLGRGVTGTAGVLDLPQAYRAYRAGTDELYPPDEQPLAAALRGDRAHATDFEIRRAEDDMVRLEVWAAPVFGLDRRVSYAVAALEDITQRETLLAERERLNGVLGARNSELEAVNRELDTFCYSVSHDLRAPLRAIDGFSRILQEDYDRVLDDEGRRLLGVVRSSTVAMGNLIDDLLTFSRFSRRPLDLAQVDMRFLAQAVADSIRASRPHGAQVTVQPLPTVPGDASLLRQVWINLIENAIKFSRNSAAPRVDVRADVVDDVVEFEVHDNGVGFDPSYGDKLFGVFQRLHRPEEFEGTGVGLAIVQRIVARHGGRVWAESEPGHGATFGFSLPLNGVPQ